MGSSPVSCKSKFLCYAFFSARDGMVNVSALGAGN